MTDPRKLIIEAFLNFRSQRTQDSADHVTRWNTIRHVQNLRQLLFEVLKTCDESFKSRQVGPTGYVHPSFRIQDPKGNVIADQRAWRKFTNSTQISQSARSPWTPAERRINEN
ncbi:MAG: hypothetical protein RL215_353 [Planctomycetota bacterium]|jgi:hypothetical protein